MSTISSDVSEFNVYVTDAYTRQWLILRCCDGGHYDLHADINATWARKATADGRMGGWSAYGVFRPGMNASVVSNFHRLGPLDRVVIDTESWKGQITGDHSAELNQLADMLAALVGQDKVWTYANQGDYFGIWPQRPQWVKLIVAGYGPTMPTGWSNFIGWQYTNGSENHTAMPSSSAPFGACDHNQLQFDVHTALGGGTPIQGEDTMAGLTQAEADMIGAATAKALLTALIGPAGKQVGLGSAIADMRVNVQGSYQEDQNQSSLLGQAVQKLS